MGVACMIGHGQIAVVQVVLAVRPAVKETERKERERGGGGGLNKVYK